LKVIQNIVLIVIDSIGAALAFTAHEYFEGGRRVQDEIINMLHYIAHRGCAIVTTNHFVYWRGEPSPSLGKRWIRAVDFRYLLWKLPDSNYYMQMIGSKCQKVINDRVFYKISDRGIDSLKDESDVVQTQDTEDGNVAERMLKRVFIARTYDEKDLRVVLSDIQVIKIISVVCISSLSAKLRRSAAAMMWHGVISRAGRSVSSALSECGTLRLMTAWRTRIGSSGRS
uniref:Rad51 domain-containing protein n=1 Tax=Elaeophora elaphi TaxID=1147741 RepID=A0A0R3RMC1_9BILA